MCLNDETVFPISVVVQMLTFAENVCVFFVFFF